MNDTIHREMTPEALTQLREHANWFLFLGIGLITIGTLGVMYSFASTLFSVIYLGVLVTAMGLFEGIKSFALSRWSSFFLHLFLSVLYIVAGIFMVLYPTINAITLTFMLALFFIISGILRIIFSGAKHVPHRFWLLANGIITLLLGILILYQWPLSGIWIIGMLVGIDAIFTGWAWIMLSLAAKQYAPNNTHTHTH